MDTYFNYLHRITSRTKASHEKAYIPHEKCNGSRKIGENVETFVGYSTNSGQLRRIVQVPLKIKQTNIKHMALIDLATSKINPLSATINYGIIDECVFSMDYIYTPITFKQIIEKKFNYNLLDITLYCYQILKTLDIFHQKKICFCNLTFSNLSFGLFGKIYFHEFPIHETPTSNSEKILIENEISYFGVVLEGLYNGYLNNNFPHEKQRNEIMEYAISMCLRENLEDRPSSKFLIKLFDEIHSSLDNNGISIEELISKIKIYEQLISEDSLLYMVLARYLYFKDIEYEYVPKEYADVYKNHIEICKKFRDFLCDPKIDEKPVFEAKKGKLMELMNKSDPLYNQIFSIIQNVFGNYSTYLEIRKLIFRKQ